MTIVICCICLIVNGYGKYELTVPLTIYFCEITRLCRWLNVLLNECGDNLLCFWSPPKRRRQATVSASTIRATIIGCAYWFCTLPTLFANLFDCSFMGRSAGNGVLYLFTLRHPCSFCIYFLFELFCLTWGKERFLATRTCFGNWKPWGYGNSHHSRKMVTSDVCAEAARALLDMVYGLGSEYNISSEEAPYPRHWDHGRHWVKNLQRWYAFHAFATLQCIFCAAIFWIKSKFSHLWSIVQILWIIIDHVYRVNLWSIVAQCF